MKRFTRVLFVTFTTVLMLSGMVGQANAALITGTVCSQPDNNPGGNNYSDPSVVCGSYLDTVSGNDASGPLSIFGTSYVQLAKWGVVSEDPDVWGWDTSPVGGAAGWSVTGTPGSNGTWTSAYNILYVLVKASTFYSVYGQGTCGPSSAATGFAFASQGDGSLAGTGSCTGGASSGGWATGPTLVNGDIPRDVSHISFYGVAPVVCDPNDPECNNPFPVPEPGVLSLLGIGLLGLGLTRRRIKV